MKKLVLILLLNVIGSIAFTQVAGYLGKKIAVGYNFNFNPVTNLGIFGPGFIEDKSVFFVTKHEGTAGFTFSKKASLQVSYISQNSKFYYPRNTDANIEFWDGSNYNLYNKIKTSVIDFGMRFHLGKFVSPVGSYVDITYGICKSGYTDDDPYIYYTDFSSGDPGPSRYDGTGSYIKYKRISIGVGNTKVIKDRFFFNVGAKLSLNHKYEFFRNNSVAESSVELVELLKDWAKPMNWMEAKIGFGILF